jgi:plasmid replication initiation protein
MGAVFLQHVVLRLLVLVGSVELMVVVYLAEVLAAVVDLALHATRRAFVSLVEPPVARVVLRVVVVKYVKVDSAARRVLDFKLLQRYFVDHALLAM